MRETPRERVMRSAGGAALLHVAYVGVANHLFEALARIGSARPARIAAETALDLGYVERWCDAAFAFELLDEAEDGTLCLSALGAAFDPTAEGTLFGFCVQAVLGAHMAERAAGLMRTGERPGEAVLGERETFLPLFGPMLEATFGPLFEAHVLPSVPAFGRVGARGGLAVDLGCGNGWYLRRLLARFEGLRGLGLDSFEENVEGARARAAAEGLSSRLQFRVGDLHRLELPEPADLLALNRALHHVWGEDGDVLRGLASHLAPGGALVVWEPAWPDERAALRDPALRGVAFQNLAEHVQGNRFLRPAEIEEALRRAGLQTEVHLLLEGREAVVVGERPA